MPMVVCVECLPADKPWDVVSVTRRSRSSGVAPRACVRVYARVLVPPNLCMHTYRCGRRGGQPASQQQCSGSFLRSIPSTFTLLLFGLTRAPGIPTCRLTWLRVFLRSGGIRMEVMGRLRPPAFFFCRGISDGRAARSGRPARAD